jgi:hypothetical protein
MNKVINFPKSEYIKMEDINYDITVIFDGFSFEKAKPKEIAEVIEFNND